jgi:bifunctional non-homologous end joining protein LigD
MSLEEYYAKRDLKKSPEPAGKMEHDRSGALKFVIQEHAASHLHYDLRLELDGVLKSWTIPKGPSLDPGKRHLAIQTEDHPLEYADFEGTFPEGSYGAGKMIIWDEGTYHVPEIEDRAENETLLRKALQRGNLKLFFDGQKIKGEFGLVKTHIDENSWLLVKKRDQYASKEDILRKDRSTRTGRQIALL